MAGGLEGFGADEDGEVEVAVDGLPGAALAAVSGGLVAGEQGDLAGFAGGGAGFQGFGGGADGFDAFEVEAGDFGQGLGVQPACLRAATTRR